MMQTSLGHKLRVLRAERGLTLREAASETGVAKETISDIERGVRHPHDVTLSKIAQGYGVPVEELLEEPVPLADAPPPPGHPDTGQPDERQASGTSRSRARDAAEGHLYVFLSWDYIEENFSFEQVLELCKGVYDRRVTVYEHGASISRELMADEVGV
jgi:transcriptional regulator with XRE-family HTH domain